MELRNIGNADDGTNIKCVQRNQCVDAKGGGELASEFNEVSIEICFDDFE